MKNREHREHGQSRAKNEEATNNSSADKRSKQIVSSTRLSGCKSGVEHEKLVLTSFLTNANASSFAGATAPAKAGPAETETLPTYSYFNLKNPIQHTHQVGLAGGPDPQSYSEQDISSKDFNLTKSNSKYTDPKEPSFNNKYLSTMQSQVPSQVNLHRINSELHQMTSNGTPTYYHQLNSHVDLHIRIDDEDEEAAGQQQDPYFEGPRGRFDNERLNNSEQNDTNLNSEASEEGAE